MHGQGLDELTLAGPSDVVELKGGTIREFTITPADAGLREAPVEALIGGTPAENAEALIELLQGAHGPYRDCVVLNAAAALVVAGVTTDLREAADRAARSIDTRAAWDVLQKLRAATNPA